MLNRRQICTGISASLLASKAAAWPNHGSLPYTPYSTPVQQFFNRCMTPLTGVNATLYAALITSLVNGGVWPLLDALYIYSTYDGSTALVNLVQPSFCSSFITIAGTPTFINNKGWTHCIGEVQNVTTNFNPSTAAGNFEQNNAMLGAWVLNNVMDSNYLVSDTNASHPNIIAPNFIGSTSYFDINGNGTSWLTEPAAVDTSGFWLIQRTASNAFAVYHNNSLFASSNQASGALVNANIVYGGVSSICGAIVIGGSLTSGQMSTLYNSLYTYMNTIGAA